MSVADLKAQASRLGKHLAEAHGVKIKHTSLQAAIAATHGARDWNTLLSTVPTSGAKLGTSIAPNGRVPQQTASLEPAQRPIEPLRIVGDISDCLATQRLLVANHIAAGGAVLCFDETGNTDMGRDMRGAAAAHGREGSYRELDIAKPARSLCYSPLAEGSAQEVTTKLLDLFPPAINLGSDYFLGQLRLILTRILSALGPGATLSRLLEVSTSAREVELLAELSGSEELLRCLLPLRSTKDGAIAEERYRSEFAGLPGRLSLLVGSDFGELLNSPYSDIRVSQMRAEGHLTYVPSYSGTILQFVISCLLRDLALHARQDAPDERTETKPPLLVVAPISLEKKVQALCPEGWRVARFISVKQSNTSFLAE